MQLDKHVSQSPSRRCGGDTEVGENRRPAGFPQAPPGRIGKYEIRGEIGRGACGVVDKGFDPFVQRDVAI